MMICIEFLNREHERALAMQGLADACQDQLTHEKRRGLNTDSAPAVVKLLACPFCGGEMEDRGYGAIHLIGKGCPIGDLAIDPTAWNRRDLAARSL